MVSAKNFAMTFFQNLVCVILAGLITYYLAAVIGSFYCGTIGGCSAGLTSLDFTTAMGLLLGYFIFIPSVLVVFGTRGKYWWILIFTLPVLALLIYISGR